MLVRYSKIPPRQILQDPCRLQDTARYCRIHAGSRIHSRRVGCCVVGERGATMVDVVSMMKASPNGRLSNIHILVIFCPPLCLKIAVRTQVWPLTPTLQAVSWIKTLEVQARSTTAPMARPTTAPVARSTTRRCLDTRSLLLSITPYPS